MIFLSWFARIFTKIVISTRYVLKKHFFLEKESLFGLPQKKNISDFTEKVVRNTTVEHSSVSAGVPWMIISSLNSSSPFTFLSSHARHDLMRDRAQELKRRAVGGGPDDGRGCTESLSSTLRGVFCERSWLPKSSSSGGFACALGRHCGLPAKTSGRFWPCRVIVLCQAILPSEMRMAKPEKKKIVLLSFRLIGTSEFRPIIYVEYGHSTKWSCNLIYTPSISIF